MPFTIINYVIIITENTSLYFLDRYVNLNIYYQAFSTAFFKTSSVNLQIKTIDSSLTNGNVITNASFAMMYYRQISISHVKWNIDLKGFSAED